MRSGLCALILLMACTSAQAKEVRFPATGKPSFTADVPELWTVTPDKQKLQIDADDHGASVSFGILALGPSDAMDDIAAAAMLTMNAPAPTRRDTATAAGLSGYTYFSKLTTTSGTPVDVRLTLARIDKKRMLLCMLMLVEGVGDDETAEAQAMEKNLRLAKP